MTDERSPEQRAADNNLDDAIRRVHAAYAGEDAMMLTQWAVCLGLHGADGTSELADVALQTSPSMPRYHLVGLLREVTLMVEGDPHPGDSPT